MRFQIFFGDRFENSLCADFCVFGILERLPAVIWRIHLKLCSLLTLLSFSVLAQTGDELLRTAGRLSDEAEDLWQGYYDADSGLDVPGNHEAGIARHQEALRIYREVLHRQGVAAFDLDRIRYLWWSVRRLRSPWSEWDSRLLSLLAQIPTEFAIYPEVRLFIAQYHIETGNPYLAARTYLEALQYEIQVAENEAGYLFRPTLSDFRAVVGFEAQLEATVEELRRQVENDAILERTMHQTLGQLSLVEVALDAINAYHLSIQEDLALPVQRVRRLREELRELFTRALNSFSFLGLKDRQARPEDPDGHGSPLLAISMPQRGCKAQEKSVISQSRGYIPITMLFGLNLVKRRHRL